MTYESDYENIVNLAFSGHKNGIFAIFQVFGKIIMTSIIMVSEAIRRNRGDQILRFIHFVNNDDFNPDSVED